MGGVGGVLHDAVGFAGASCKENVQDGWESDYSPGRFYSILESRILLEDARMRGACARRIALTAKKTSRFMIYWSFIIEWRIQK